MLYLPNMEIYKRFMAPASAVSTNGKATQIHSVATKYNPIMNNVLMIKTIQSRLTFA